MQVWTGVTRCDKGVTSSELRAVTNPLRNPRPTPRPMQGLSAALMHDTQHRHLQAAAARLPRPPRLRPVHFAHSEVCWCGAAVWGYEGRGGTACTVSTVWCPPPPPCLFCILNPDTVSPPLPTRLCVGMGTS